jgi:hypothetical protein
LVSDSRKPTVFELEVGFQVANALLYTGVG